MQQTALHLASASDATDAVEYLLSLGASITEDSLGQTAIDLAIAHKNAGAAMAFVNSLHWKEFVRLPSRVYGSVVLGFILNLPNVMKVRQR